MLFGAFSQCKKSHKMPINFCRTSYSKFTFLTNLEQDFQFSTILNMEKINTRYENHTNVKKVGAHLRISFWHLLMNLKNK